MPVRTGRRRASRIDSRERLLAAAASEFAARGFAGANVDRIARAARVNKAMIYYHFGSKAALYREILQDVFGTIAERVAAVAAGTASPADKIRAFVEAIASEAQARPHFPPVWFREVAEGGVHLDDATLAHITSVVRSLGAMMNEGVRGGQFTRMDPFIIHAGIIGPLLLFFASGRLRIRAERAGLGGAARLGRDEVVAHVQRVALATLEGRVG